MNGKFHNSIVHEGRRIYFLKKSRRANDPVCEKDYNKNL